MDGLTKTSSPDLDLLKRLKSLSFLSAAELSELARDLVLANFKKHEVICPEKALATDVHILLKGIARITCQSARDERATVALLAPGPIPQLPSLPLSGFGVRCEAYNECRVGSLSWHDFNRITMHSSESAFKKLHELDLQQWYRLLLRSSSLLNLDLHERVALTLLELASGFGIQDSRGMLLGTSFSQQDIADLAGASRPRVTEHLAQLEREQLLIRQGRRLIVCADAIGKTIAESRLREPSSHAHSRKAPRLVSQEMTSSGRGSTVLLSSSHSGIRQAANEITGRP